MLVGISVFFWTVSRVGLKDWNCLKRRDFHPTDFQSVFLFDPKIKGFQHCLKPLCFQRMYLTGSRATRIYQELLAYIGYFGCILPVPHRGR